jgi:hypothetical protein
VPPTRRAHGGGFARRPGCVGSATARRKRTRHRAPRTACRAATSGGCRGVSGLKPSVPAAPITHRPSLRGPCLDRRRCREGQQRRHVDEQREAFHGLPAIRHGLARVLDHFRRNLTRTVRAAPGRASDRASVENSSAKNAASSPLKHLPRSVGYRPSVTRKNRGASDRDRSRAGLPLSSASATGPRTLDIEIDGLVRLLWYVRGATSAVV